LLCIYIYVRYVLLCTGICITHCISPYIDRLFNHLVYIASIVYALYCMHCILYCIHICIIFCFCWILAYIHICLSYVYLFICISIAAIAHIFMYIHIYMTWSMGISGWWCWLDLHFCLLKTIVWWIYVNIGFIHQRCDRQAGLRLNWEDLTGEWGRFFSHMSQYGYKVGPWDRVQLCIIDIWMGKNGENLRNWMASFLEQ